MVVADASGRSVTIAGEPEDHRLQHLEVHDLQ